MPRRAALVKPRRRLTGALVLGAIVALGAAPSAGAATVNVSTTAQLQAAVAAALSGDVIVLAAGAYAPTRTLEAAVGLTIQGPPTAPGASISGASIPNSAPSTDVVDLAPGTTVVLRDLTIMRTALDGFAVLANGALTLERTTFTLNDGPSVWINPGSSAAITNATIAANPGVGIVVGGTLTVRNSTIAGNTGDGIANTSLTSFTTLQNTIVFGNGDRDVGTRDCVAPVESHDHSLDGDSSCGIGALSATNPLLAPLAANGGPTQTRALPAGSPALNAGSSALCLATDQRGVGRTDGLCDIGAFERDTVAPVISVPPAITADATSASGAIVAYTATATDNAAVTSFGCVPASGTLFAVGTRTVTCSATDSSANTSTASFAVTVRDAGPVIAATSAVTAEATGPAGATATYPTPTATDALDGPRPVACAPASGSTFAVGVTTVTCTSSDTNGTVSTATFAVTVRDTRPPTIAGVPAPITTSMNNAVGASVNYSRPTASDIVDGAVPVVCDPPPASNFPVGTTTVTCTATDAHGNAATASFQITVTDPSPGGRGCVGADGKISGRGSSFQAAAQALLTAGFRDDVCGATTQGASDPGGTSMVAFNYPAGAAGGTDSEAGQRAVSCRTDTFGAADTPYDEATWAALAGAPGALGGCAIGWSPPYGPTSGPFPDPADAAAPVMSFPIAASSVAVLVSLTAADCGGAAPAAPKLTAAALSRLLGGDIARWNDPALVADNPSLAGCNITVSRVPPFAAAPSTATVKNYLARADGSRATSLGCGAPGGAPAPWSSFGADAWPGTGTCSVLSPPSAAGNAALVTTLKATHGAIGFVDVVDAVPASPPLLVATVRNATNTSFQGPRSGRTANCAPATLTLPGATTADAVGLNPSDNWASDNGAGNHSNLTNLGAQYPICGLTFALVPTKLGSPAGSAMTRLTLNQRRTLYAFETYVFSSAGQDRLGSGFYTALPGAWLTKLRAGFQTNF